MVGSGGMEAHFSITASGHYNHGRVTGNNHFAKFHRSVLFPFLTTGKVLPTRQVMRKVRFVVAVSTPRPCIGLGINRQGRMSSSCGGGNWI